MMKLPISKYEIILDKSFSGYVDATNEELERVIYDTDAEHDSDENYCILTFDEIRSDFESWTPEERSEVLQDQDSDDYTVYDWIRDCLMNSLSVVSHYRIRENDRIIPVTVDPSTIDPNTFESRFVGRSGCVITIDRYGSDDYSATWDESYSVRGTLEQVLEELKGEL